MFKKRSDPKKELELYRRKIDKIDNKLVKLLNERVRLVKIVGEIKKKNNIEISQPQREKEVIERMKSRSKLLKNGSIEVIWREIIKACKVFQANGISDN
ncbi:MAG: chorismate mutase [Candidatus Thorarchaeota archaeon]